MLTITDERYRTGIRAVNGESLLEGGGFHSAVPVGAPRDECEPEQ